MDDRKLQIIQELMDQLKEEMQPGKEDFASRLGRKEPDLKVMSISGKMDPMADADSDSDVDMPGMDKSMGMDSDDDGGDMSMSPEDELKERLMRMRG